MRELRIEEYRLLKESKALQNLALDHNISRAKAFKVKAQQNKTYKKWKFYDELLKEMEKRK